MTKPELVADAAKRAGISREKTAKALNGIMEAIMNAVAEGDNVKLVGFGCFEAVQRNERKARNPKTNEEIIIPARKMPVFKVGKEFKDLVMEEEV